MTRTNHRMIVALVLLALGFAAAQPAHAVLFARDGFETYSVGANLDGQNDGTGWMTAWDAGDTAAENDTTVQLKTMNDPNGLSFGGTKAARILPSPSNVGNDNDLVQRRPLDSITGPLYVGMLLRPESFENDDFLQFQVSNGAEGDNANTLSWGIRNTTNNPFFARVGVAANSTNSSTAFATDDTDFLVVAKISKDANVNYNRVDLYVNPTSYNESEQTPVATRLGPATAISVLSLFNVRINNFDTDDRVFFDNLILSDNFAVAAGFIPEPGTALLAAMGLGSLIAGLRRRRPM